jgi:hypothetical protein
MDDARAQNDPQGEPVTADADFESPKPTDDTPDTTDGSPTPGTTDENGQPVDNPSGG